MTSDLLQLVIPAYNEAGRLPGTLSALRDHVTAVGFPPGSVEVIVVDNRSTDLTAVVAEAADSGDLPVRVVRCAQPGKGAAVRAGILATSAPVIGFMDADGATRLDALERGLRLIDDGAEVAVGSRAVPGSVTTERHSAFRVTGARAYRWSTRRVAPGIADTQCGFKLFRGDLGRELFGDLVSTGFSFDVEVLGRAQRRGATVREFPVTWDDVPGSTFDPIRHGAAAFWELARIALRLKHAPLAQVHLLRRADAVPAARDLPPAAEA